MPRPRARSVAPLFLLAALLFAHAARAQKIVLLRPKTPDPALQQAFGRLQGELSAHDFEVVVVEASSDAPSPRELADVAERASAVASVSLLRSAGLASADVWISDRVTGKTSMRTIATEQRGEAPSVLAIRAVDLLRVSLREFANGEEPPPEIVGATPARAPAHVRAWASSAARSRASVEASFVVESALSKLGSTYGPSLGLGYDALDRVRLQLVFQELTGPRTRLTDASVTLREEQLFARAGFRLFERLPFALAVTAAVGAHHVRVQGDAAAPLVGESGSAWVALFAAGLGGRLALTRAAAIFVGGSALLLAPRVVVEAAEHAHPYGRPLLAFDAGLNVSF